MLFLTGRVDVTDRVAALDAGGDDYLTKPVAMAELRAVTRRAPGARPVVLRAGDSGGRRRGSFRNYQRPRLSRQPPPSCNTAPPSRSGHRNITNDDLLGLFGQHLEAITAALDKANFVELGPGVIVVHADR